MPRSRTAKSFTKSRLVKELSWSCGLPQTKVKALLEEIVGIARREAGSTFVLPGICRLEVVRRKPRKVRNPRTGETFMLPEREALRITAPRSLKLVFARPVGPEDDEPAPDAEAEAVAEAAEEEAVAVDPNALISFRCPRCQQEVEATGDMVGFETECPTCGNPITVPAESEPGTIHGGGEAAGDDGEEALHAPVVTSHEAESINPEQLKGLTIRIDVDDLDMGGAPKPAEEAQPEHMVSFICAECKQEIEASRDMVGETTACPNCGAPIIVPAESASNTLHGSPDADQKTLQAMKGRTMRIDIGEDF
ncbi:MAG: HU family DNA-binding protein [Kiritimatiellae bacterium]|nr:HU family DNA-binding protein [Kiritimatiellia bacterium]